MAKMSEYERETIIYFNESENDASIFTFDAGLKRRLADFGRKYPLLCYPTRITAEGGVLYTIDKSRLSIFFIPPDSEEQRATMREYAEKYGIRVVNTAKEIA